MTNKQVISQYVEHLRGRGKASGRNSNGSIYYDNNTIYSYGHHFPMATMAYMKVYVNTARYSNTTSRHQSTLRRALDQAGIEYQSVDMPTMMLHI